MDGDLQARLGGVRGEVFVGVDVTTKGGRREGAAFLRNFNFRSLDRTGLRHAIVPRHDLRGERHKYETRYSIFR